MSALDDIAKIEDSIIAILLGYPDLVLSLPIDITLFDKRRLELTAIIKLTGRGIVADIFTVSDELKNNDLVYELGCLQKDLGVSRHNYSHLIKTLKAKVTDVRIYKTLSKSLKSIEKGQEATKVLGKLVSDALVLVTSNSERKHDFSSKEMMSAMIDKLEDIHDRDGKPLGVKTGISKLDDVLGSLHPSDMCIVGARPGVGKTAMGVTVMLNVAREGHKVGFISTEMSVDQIAFRASAQISNLNSRKYRKADFEEKEWPRITASVKQLSEMPIRICDKPVMKVSDVMLQCQAWKLDGGIDFIIIDYLTRIRPDQSSGSQHIDVGEIATQMKNIARDLNIPVMVLAQLNRQSSSRSDSNPRISDLRDSGVIEQEADSILLLHRDEDDNGIKHSLIIVGKNRHGECVEASVNFDEQVGRWWCEDNNF